MPDDKPLQQQYHEEVEALKADGLSNADAIRAVAQRHNKKENAVRGGIHQYRNRQSGNGASATPRRRGRAGGARSVDELVAGARQSLEEALTLIDREVDEARQTLDAAQAHYDSVQAAVAERRSDIESKLQALS
jgi:uncharacterized protein YoaH (UPF0181 family)